MLNSFISEKTRAWFQREDCPAADIVAYMASAGHLRDAQIEAIKTYLFLKMAWNNHPLSALFCDGLLTQNEDLSRLPISEAARAHLEADTAARSLFSFSRMKLSGSKTALPELEKYLAAQASEVDCCRVAQEMFYGVEYPDYLFSLPMGAGKTFLMAAFIYLDLYFAQNEPDNKAFAHNFILLVPSGLKSSIIPSLKTIENFDPAWVLPEPAASNIRKMIKFEILDQPKSAKKSNKAQNPNAQKISQYQPFDTLMGLVIVTNAEKVILDKVKLDPLGLLTVQTDDEKDKEANELRNLIGKVPNLQILIDEVHHAATDDVKLRQVVNGWNRSGSINGVLGFSGTPYLSSPDPLQIADGISVKFSQITNTVFYYPLTTAIQNFLKKPQVRTITELSSSRIVRHGVQDFLKQYGSKRYANGATAKLAIYCGSIERLEEEVYPLLIGELGIAPDDILKYHRGNPKYKPPVNAESEFKSLDTAVSQKRIVLLVQIGKEGWDCRSLTGVILSQKGDCPTNMVLQTSCRCLRQMDGTADSLETAGIWLNAENAKVLDKQLAEEQNTSIEELNALGKGIPAETRPRFSRAEHLALPPVDFYQLQVQYQTVTSEEAAPQNALSSFPVADFRTNAAVVARGLAPGGAETRWFLGEEQGEIADFSAWLLGIAKGSFGSIAVRDLRAFEPPLRAVFDALTYEDDGVRYFDARYAVDDVAAQIRLAFCCCRTLTSTEEMIHQTASLLIAAKVAPVAVSTKNLYPTEAETSQMQEMDASGQTASDYVQAQRANVEKLREMAKALGTSGDLFTLRDVTVSTAIENKDRSFHVVPYNFDSSFEREFLEEALKQKELKDRGLELYFNGAGELTEFQIKCFARRPHGWTKVGIYTPDFLLIERKAGQIHRALIIETKGKGFADQREFVVRRKFVQEEFLSLNNAKFGYKRFDYLYLSDADDLKSVNLHKLCEATKAFFTD